MVRMGSLRAGLVAGPSGLEGRVVDAADEETREIYARYGLAMYFAQVVEHAIVNLMVALRLPERGRLTVADIDELMNQAFGMTFGALRPDPWVTHVVARPGSGGQSPPRSSMARATSASGERNPNAMRVRCGSGAGAWC